MQKLIIFPYNGNGLEAFYCIDNKFEFIGFADDEKHKQGHYKNYHVYTRDIITKYPEALILAVPGSPDSFKSRKKIIDDLKVDLNRYVKIIHPQTSISKDAKLGFNILIMAGVVITSNAVIGNHVCILPNSVIHHDVTIGDLTLIGSNVNIASETQVGENCYIGSGSNIINKASIGKKTLIGLGTNVIKSIPSNSKAIGNPAKLI